jgi:hypothetical protein
MVTVKTHGDRTLFFDFLPFFGGDFHKKRFDIGEKNWLNQMMRIN